MKANKQRVIALYPDAKAMQDCRGWFIAGASLPVRHASRFSNTPRRAWALAAVVAKPVVERPRHTHKHKCDSCGTVWEHVDDCGGSLEAHTCPQCGQEQWSKYWGESPPLGPPRLCMPPVDKEMRHPRAAVDLISLLDQLFSR